ncbi:MAG: AmmeMemoRadiSam system protein A [Candidatus Aenigmatarchaeota archaeon]
METQTKRFVIEFARKVIENFVKNENVLEIPKDFPEELKSERGVFVTIFKNGELRGCIGYPYPTQSAIKNLREAAVGVTRDPRFPPLKKGELEEIVIEVSILTEPKLIEVKKSKEYLERIEPHKDGLIIKNDMRSGLFLPQVWEQLPDKIEFLTHLCLKAGLSSDEWISDGTTIYKFQVEFVKEDEI